MVDFNLVNRWRFSDAFYDQIIDRLSKKLLFHKFIRDFNPEVKKGRLYIDGKPVIREKNVERFVKYVILNTSAPLGIESLHSYIGKRYGFGVSRREIKKILGADTKYQNMRKRGDRPAGKRYEREGKTSQVYAKYKNPLGMDLIEIGDKFERAYVGDIRYLLVVVHKFTGYTFVRTARDKKAATILREFKKIYEQCKQIFGVSSYLERDAGGEFVSDDWAAYRKKEGLFDRVERKSSFVEARNSLLQRNLHMIARAHAFKKALDLAVRKINNTPNRTLGGRTPNELSQMKDKPRKRYKKYKNKESNRVRKFSVGDKVHYLLKQSQRGNAFYKSFADHWSKSVHTVEKKVGKKYKISGISYTLFPDELVPVQKQIPLTSENKEEDAVQAPEGAVVAQRKREQEFEEKASRQRQGAAVTRETRKELQARARSQRARRRQSEL